MSFDHFDANTGSMATNEDPAAEFLEREKRDLGDLGID